MKRFLDIIFSSILIVLLSPLLVLTGFMVKAVLGSPILFVQQRPGYKGKPFSIYKFRSLTNQRDEAGKLLADHLRFNRFSAFLRHTSLDELPELFNVLIGDMSFVGPRPLLMQYLDRYSMEQARRHNVKPGITGWAQVNGRNAISWDEKFRMDVWYVDNQNLLLDFKILVMTVSHLINPKGVSQDDHVTAKEFMGRDEDGK